MEKFSLAKFLGITEKELLVTSAKNIKRNAEEEEKLNAAIAKLEELSPEEMLSLEKSLGQELLKPPTMPTHGINY